MTLKERVSTDVDEERLDVGFVHPRFDVTDPESFDVGRGIPNL